MRRGLPPGTATACAVLIAVAAMVAAGIGGLVYLAVSR